MELDCKTFEQLGVECAILNVSSYCTDMYSPQFPDSERWQFPGIDQPVKCVASNSKQFHNLTGR